MNNTIKLFTQPNCPQCVQAKVALEGDGFTFDTLGIDALPEACEAIGMDITQIKSSPVIIQEDMIWTGADCVVAVEEGELV